MRFNEKSAIEEELDIYIPKLSFAVELNGPTHYFPIFGQDKLEAEQKNDALKREKCKKLGIELMEVDVSDFKTFKKNFKLILIVEGITNKIKEKLKAVKE